MTLNELNKAFAQRAALSKLEVQCLGDGNVNADTVIIGEYPQGRDLEMHIPFVGGSGKFLWECLGFFSIRRQHVYMTNVVKKQVVEDAKTKKRAIGKNELSHWKALLDWELAQLPNVKYVLLLGEFALNAMTGHDSIKHWRGSVVEDGKYTYIITNNPSQLMFAPMLEPIFRLDCNKLDMVRKGTYAPYHIDAAINPSPKEAIAFCDRMIQEDEPISLDIETIANETACIGLANNAHYGMCINLRDRDTNRFSADDERRVRFSVQRVLRHSRTRLIAQNGGFDNAWLWYKDRIKVKKLWMDTLLAHHTLYPTWPHNLGFLTAQYTTHPYYKDELHAWREGGNIDSFWEYNVKDCCITWEVARRLERELQQQHMWCFFQEHVMRLQPYLIEATVLGNKVDTVMRDRLNVEYGEYVDTLGTQFRDAARCAVGDAALDVNPNSPKQLGELFFRTLKLVGRTTKTDEANRNYMIESPRTPEPAREMLRILNKYKEEHKLLSTYISAEIDDDGRMRSDYKQFGTQFVPGRLSSSSTLWGSGMNLQNQPERLRGMFIADTLEVRE